VKKYIYFGGGALAIWFLFLRKPAATNLTPAQAQTVSGLTPDQSAAYFAQGAAAGADGL
jgi:hypothetical protein